MFEVVDVHHPTVAGRLAEEDPVKLPTGVLRAKQIGYVVLSPALVRAQPEQHTATGITVSVAPVNQDVSEVFHSQDFNGSTEAHLLEALRPLAMCSELEFVVTLWDAGAPGDLVFLRRILQGVSCLLYTSPSPRD